MGGPGNSCIPLTQKFNASLEEHFNFINLEQRDAGLSYYKFSAHRLPRIATFIEDIHLFVEYLLKRFHQERLILIGQFLGFRVRYALYSALSSASGTVYWRRSSD